MRSFPAACLAGLLSIPVAAQSGGAVSPPPGWYKGDTHLHVQLCLGLPQLTPEDMYQKMLDEDIVFGGAQLWGVNLPSSQAFLDQFGWLVTGAESPTTLGDPVHFMQYGIELSEFRTEQFGHAQLFGISSPYLPFDEPYPAPAFDLVRQDPKVLTGYAHVNWSTSYLPALVPVIGEGVDELGIMSPLDAALGKIDFIESPRVNIDPFFGWYGLYYKLLNSGFRVALTGGKDNSCLNTPITMYSKVEQPLSFQGWLESIRAGRTTISDGEHLFLDLEVNGAFGLGDELQVLSTSPLNVKATLTVGPGVQLPGQKAGSIHLIHDGGAVQSVPYSLPEGGVAVAEFTLPVTESGWIAAWANNDTAFLDGGAHTGAIYFTVDGKPRCRKADGDYFVTWADYLLTAIQLGTFDVDPVTELPELEAYVAEARKVFAAVAACDTPDPVGVQRYGVSKPSCKGPLHLDVTGVPSVTATDFHITTLNAPPDAVGGLLVGIGANPSGVGFPLFPAYVDLLLPFTSFPVSSNGGGYSEILVEMTPTVLGGTSYVQTFWFNTPSCTGFAGGIMCSSDALELTFQP